MHRDFFFFWIGVQGNSRRLLYCCIGDLLWTKKQGADNSKQTLVSLKVQKTMHKHKYLKCRHPLPKDFAPVMSKNKMRRAI